MGRAKKGVARQIAAGDPRKVGKQKLQLQLDSQPKPVRGLPECPKHLKGKAAIAWSYLREQLEAMNLDHMPDALALEFGCLAYAAALAAEEQLAREGSVIVVNGNPKTHPATRVRNQAWARFIQFTDRFGLSPRARESLSIDTAGDAHEELMAILSAPRPKKANNESLQ